MRCVLTALICTSLAVLAAAQDNPLTAQNRSVYSGLERIVLRSAEKVPAELYSFRPTDAVRTFGQILGHIADSQYYYCSAIGGERNPAPGIEKDETSKEELISALNDAFAYCGKAYGSVTDASVAEIVKMSGAGMPKLAVLAANNLHTAEHYGNLVTYMRLNEIVPPTSESQAEAPPSP